ncbi:MAG: hypothetical protein IJQ31_10920 [Thermoguttaceae bacterium]|nr:hypothetical protein [Thermoguttaceae bacterium]
MFAQLPTDAVELIFPGGDGVMALSSNYYYSPTENTFYFQKTVRIPGQGRVTTYTPVPADEIDPSISNLAVPYGYQSPSFDNGTQGGPTFELDPNFSGISFSSALVSVGSEICFGLVLALGLAGALLAVRKVLKVIFKRL